MIEPKNLGWAIRDIENDVKWRPCRSLELNVIKYASIIYQWIGNLIWNNFLYCVEVRKCTQREYIGLTGESLFYYCDLEGHQ